MADSVSIQYSTVYSGNEAPAGSSAWLSTILTDTQGQSSNAVLLTVDASGLVGSEFVSGFYFNLAQAINPGSIRFSEVSRQNFVGNVNFFQGQQDDQNAGGGFRFDLGLAFPTQGGQRLGAGGVYSILLERDGGLSIYDLLVETQSTGYGNSLSVAHVQSLWDGSSAWITAGTSFSTVPGTGGAVVPEPSTWAAAAVMAGLVVFPVWRRRRSVA